MGKVNSFDVLKELSRQNKTIRAFFFNDNLKRINAGKGGWGDVTVATVAIDSATAQQLMAGNNLVGMVLVYDIHEFLALTEEMEARAEIPADIERTEAANRLLRTDLENVKRMWKETIERKKEIEAALRRFADISLVEPVDLEKFAYDILNARKALKGE